MSGEPVIVSHANARALTPHPRNLSDDTIRALADKGGVIGIVAWSVICQIKPNRRATLDDFLDHLDHVVKLVGVDHVGIGSDINENARTMPIPTDFQTQYRRRINGDVQNGDVQDVDDVEGFAWLHEYLNVVGGLVYRGYSDESEKIMGGNFLRVAQQVWGSE